MKTNYRHLLLSMFISSTLSISLSAQTARNPTNDMNEMSRRSTAREVQQRDNQQRESGAGQVSMLDYFRGSWRSSSSGGLNISKEYRKQFEKTADQILPPASYYQKYVDALKGDKHELARLQQEKNCFNDKVLAADDAERCANAVPVHGNGSYYSFINQFNYLTYAEVFRISFGREPFDMIKDEKNAPVFGAEPDSKRNPLNNWWDIHYENNHLEVGKNGIQGIIADLGKRDLSSITINSPELNFLTNYQPATTFEETEKQIEALAKGVTTDNLFYTNSSPVQLDHTYILRSIHYPYKPDYLTEKRDSHTSKGGEITVAFQVVGKENDGSIIILWKELNKKKLSQKYKM